MNRIFGKGLLEIVYKDAIEYEFNEKKIPYEREKKYEVEYKGLILPHFFFADFVVFDKIILEVKAQKGIVDEHYRWVINYLVPIHRDKLWREFIIRQLTEQKE